MELPQKLAFPFDDPSMKTILYIIQGCATGIGLILVPLLYLRTFEKIGIGEFIPDYNIELKALLIAIIIVPVFMFVNSVFIEWNQGLELPGFMESVENWMRTTEEQAMKLTNFLTSFESIGIFLFSIVVIAVLPAIGEELVFRGVMQREFGAAFKNPHIGVWLAAFLFSAIHMQFYGFIPRMLLGGLFGYLYLWSGNLIFPIIAHFVQNGSQLLLLFLNQKNVISIDMDDTESYPIYIVIIFGILTAFLLIYFRKIYKERSIAKDGKVDESV